MSRVHASALRVPWHSEVEMLAFSLARDMWLVWTGLLRDNTLRLGSVVIDPITAYLGGTDSHKNADVRAVLAPLAELASRNRAAIVAVHHLNKATDPMRNIAWVVRWHSLPRPERVG